MKEPSGIRAVVFDMDGVLTDSEPLINRAAVSMFLEQGLTVRPEDFLPFVGAGEDRYIGGVAEAYAFPLDLPSAKRRTYEIYLQLVPTELRSFPGAQALVSPVSRRGVAHRCGVKRGCHQGFSKSGQNWLAPQGHGMRLSLGRMWWPKSLLRRSFCWRRGGWGCRRAPVL